MRLIVALTCLATRLTYRAHLPKTSVVFSAIRSMSTTGKKFSLTNVPDLSDAPPSILSYLEDKYDGVIVDSEKLPDNDAGFTEAIDASLSYWRSHHRRGVWLKVPIEKASFIPIATSRGFQFHHAENSYLMLTHWLADGENRLPANASHQVGVGCVVINKEGHLLLVQEKSGPLRGTGIWKLPTGLSDAGEDISTAAEREVLEETGVEAKFKKLLCFRQAHNLLFGKSDLFYVCLVEPLTSDIAIQEAEIVAASWCPPNTLWDQKFFQKSPLHSRINDIIRLEVAALMNNTERPGWIAQKMPIGFRPGENTLYYAEDGLDTTAGSHGSVAAASSASVSSE